MRHGDEIQILIDGPSIRLKSLEPIGITHNSQCWGVWIDRRIRPDEPTPANDPREFIISPIHPSLWPFAFRIEAALNPAKGTIKSLCQQLNENGANILYIDQAPSGYTHSIFNAICSFDASLDPKMFGALEAMESEVAKVRKTVTGPTRGLRISAARTEEFKKLGIRMIIQLTRLWARLRIKEQQLFEACRNLEENAEKLKQNVSYDAQDMYFLATRVIEQGLEPWFLSVLGPDGELIKPTDDSKVATAAVEANDLIKNILEEEIGPGENGATTQKLSDLLKELQKAHKRTRYRYGPEQLTIQAKLAAMDEVQWQRHVLRRIEWRHTHLPLAVNALIRLAEMRFWMAPFEPIEFHYDADQQVLRPESQAAFQEQISVLGQCGQLRRDKPVWALATYHHEDRFVRFKFLPESKSRNRFRVEIDYKVPGKPAKDSQFATPSYRPARTKGLIAKICGAILEANGNILRMTNSIGTFDPETEEEIGKLRITAEFECSNWSDADQDVLQSAIYQAVDSIINPTEYERKKISGATEPSDGACIKMDRAACSVRLMSFKRERIFISTVFSHGRFNEFRSMLDEIAGKYGLETRYAMSNTRSVSLNVHEKIAECRYFLQIITARKEEQGRMRTDHEFVPDFTWVTYEHGCAVALQHEDHGRRCVQMVDELLSDLSKERLNRTRGDIAPLKFRIDDDPLVLRDQFQSAIEALIRDD